MAVEQRDQRAGHGDSQSLEAARNCSSPTAVTTALRLKELANQNECKRICLMKDFFDGKNYGGGDCKWTERLEESTYSVIVVVAAIHAGGTEVAKPT